MLKIVGCQSYTVLLFHIYYTSLFQILLGLARGLFEDTTCMETLIKKIMVEAKELIPCEVCRVLLVNDNPPGVSFTHHNNHTVLAYCDPPSLLLQACAQIEFNKGFEMGKAVGSAAHEMK